MCCLLSQKYPLRGFIATRISIIGKQIKYIFKDKWYWQLWGFLASYLSRGFSPFITPSNQKRTHSSPCATIHPWLLIITMKINTNSCSLQTSRSLSFPVKYVYIYTHMQNFTGMASIEITVFSLQCTGVVWCPSWQS